MTGAGVGWRLLLRGAAFDGRRAAFLGMMVGNQR